MFYIFGVIFIVLSAGLAVYPVHESLLALVGRKLQCSLGEIRIMISSEDTLVILW